MTGWIRRERDQIADVEVGTGRELTRNQDVRGRAEQGRSRGGDERDHCRDYGMPAASIRGGSCVRTATRPAMPTR